MEKGPEGGPLALREPIRGLRRPLQDRSSRAGRVGRGVRQHRSLQPSSPRLPVHPGDVVAGGGAVPGRGSVRRREGARHDGDAAHQPGQPRGDRLGQVPDDLGLQRRHRPAQPAQHGPDRLQPQQPDAQRRLPPGRAAVERAARPAAVGVFQRGVPRGRRLRPQLQGRAILPDAALLPYSTAYIPHDGAGRGAEPVLQHGAGHGVALLLQRLIIVSPDPHQGAPGSTSSRCWRRW